jgi:hypothetical protein
VPLAQFECTLVAVNHGYPRIRSLVPMSAI